jgi:hypothetical protein
MVEIGNNLLVGTARVLRRRTLRPRIAQNRAQNIEAYILASFTIFVCALWCFRQRRELRHIVGASILGKRISTAALPRLDH